MRATQSPNQYRLFLTTDPAPTEIYTLSLHDALPILPVRQRASGHAGLTSVARPGPVVVILPPSRVVRARGKQRRSRSAFDREDRKSTRLNSSHGYISYAVFCLKKKTPNPPDRLAAQP